MTVPAARTPATSPKSSRRAELEEAVLPAIVGLLVALIVGDILILSFRQNPGHVYRCSSKARGGTRTDSGRCCTRRRL
jgi:hypothetical protein